MEVSLRREKNGRYENSSRGSTAELVLPRRGGLECSSDGSGCLWAGVRALLNGWCGGGSRHDEPNEALSPTVGSARAASGASSSSARGAAPLKKRPADFHVASATPFVIEEDEQVWQPPKPRRRIMAATNGLYPSLAATPSLEVSSENDQDDPPREKNVPPIDGAAAPPVRTILKEADLRESQSATSLSGESDTDFEESEASLRRVRDRHVLFALERNQEHEITALRDMSWCTRRDCYWQPDEYAAMSQSRLWLERAVLQTGGRVRIEGESRRGLGLVCEPETRLARASKIQHTQRAVLRMHAEGASASRLAKFAADASHWATRNALICAQKDLVAAHEDDGSASFSSSPAAYVATLGDLEPDPDAGSIPRCDSNTSETNGLASLIRNDSLGNLAEPTDDNIQAYARARRRDNWGCPTAFDNISPNSSVSAVSA